MMAAVDQMMFSSQYVKRLNAIISVVRALACAVQRFRAKVLAYMLPP